MRKNVEGMLKNNEDIEKDLLPKTQAINLEARQFNKNAQQLETETKQRYFRQRRYFIIGGVALAVLIIAVILILLKVFNIL